MGRQEYIARSIALAITKHGQPRGKPRGILWSILAAFATFFTLFQLVLEKFRPADFANLRRNRWGLDDDAYSDSFQSEELGQNKSALNAIGDMGYSGSTFFATRDSKYLIKSIPRPSEYTFFRDELFTPYIQFMATNSSSMLVRITDFLWAPGISIGKLLGLAPTHHIIMENIMYGQDKAEERGEIKWEHWDLKPTTYFYPERDIADGRLTSEATKSQLADEFHDSILLCKDDAESFLSSLAEDTKLLASHNAVDYSLFLVRIQVEGQKPQRVADPGASAAAESSVVPTEPPAVPPFPPSWRTGVASSDGKHLYRVALLDFFWAKHKPQAKMMTFLVNTWNLLISKKGPMSITTEADEYRERFLKMCRGYVQIQEDVDH